MIARSRRTLPLGLLGAIAMAIAIESAVGGHALDLMTDTAWDWRTAGESARSRKIRDAEILCVGDSLVKLSVAPTVLRDRLGRPSRSLAIANGRAPSTYFLLKRALDNGARPRVLVIDFMPHLLALDHREPSRYWPELLSVAEAIDLSRTAGDPGLLAQILAAKALPTLRSRDELRSLAVATLAGHPTTPRHVIPALWRNWRVNLGAQLAPPKPEYDGSIPPDNVACFPDRWACDPVNRDYLRRTLDLAACHGMTVYWLIPPAAPSVIERRARLGLDVVESEFVRSWQRDYPNVVVVDARRSGYDRSVFVDPVHLAVDGAGVLSADLADLIAAVRPDRWLALPQFGDRPTVHALEHTMDSLAAIRSRSQGARR